MKVVKIAKVVTVQGPTVADLAAAHERGTDVVRSLLAPLLPALYTFVARRSHDAEEAEDVLVETLLRARADAGRQADPHAPLLGWLLREADRSVRDGVEPSERNADRRLLEAGLRPNFAVPHYRTLPWLLDALARLPHDELSALGMRFGDGLPLPVISQVLDTPVPDTASLLEDAIRCVQENCRPDERFSRLGPVDLDSYISGLLGSGPAERPAEVGPGLQVVLETLASTHATASLTSAQQAAVWRRCEQEQQAFLPGRPLPSLPSWLAPALLGGLVLLALAGVALWLFGREADEPRRSAPAVQPTAGSAADPPGAPTQPTAAPSGGPQAFGGPAFRHEGRIFYVQPSYPSSRLPPAGQRRSSSGRGNVFGTLMYADMEDRAPDGSIAPRPIVDLPRAGGQTGRYAVSPSGSQILYFSEGDLWVHSVGAPKKGKLLDGAALSRRGSAGRSGESSQPPGAGAMAWHPDGHTVAVVVEPDTRDGIEPLEVVTVRLNDLKLTRIATLRGHSAVGQLSYSPDGRYLLATTERGMVVIDTGGERRTRFYDGIGRAYWSGDADSPRLLWMGSGTQRPIFYVEDGVINADFGVMNADGSGRKGLGQAMLVAWEPESGDVLSARYVGGEAGALLFRQHDPRTGQTRELSRVEAVPPTRDSVAFGPDGGHMVYGATDGLYMIHYSRTGRVEKLADPTGPVTSLQWQEALPRPVVGEPPIASPTREAGIALWVEPGPTRRLMGWEVFADGPVELASGEDLQYRVSPFGAKVAVSKEGTLSVLDLERGTDTLIAQAASGGSIRSPTWSPSGSELAYILESPSFRARRTDIWSVNLITGNQRFVSSDQRLISSNFRGGAIPLSVRYSPSGRWLLASVSGVVEPTGRGWWLLGMDGDRARELPPADRYEWSPQPGPERLLRLEDRKASVVDLMGRVLAPVPSEVVHAQWAGPDSLLLVDARLRLTRYDLSTGRTQALGTLPEWRAERVVASRLGRLDWAARFSATADRDGVLLYSRGSRLAAVRLGRAGAEDLQARPSGEAAVLTEPAWIPTAASLRSPAQVGRLESPSPRPRTKILFTDQPPETDGSRGGFRPLWMRDAVSGDTERLAEVSGYSIHPDDGHLVYVDPTGMWLLDLQRDEERQLIEFEDGVTDLYTRLADPRWAPGGARISFLVQPRDPTYGSYMHLPPGLHVLDPQTGEIDPVVVGEEEAALFRTAQWLTDGGPILAATSRRAILYSAQNGQRLWETEFRGHGEPALSPVPADRFMLSLEHRPGRREGELAVYSEAPRRLVLSERAHTPVWSPKGDSVYYFEGDRLWQSSKDGNRKRLVAADIQGAAEATSPAWTPDGDLSYVSGKSAWEIDPDTGAVEKLYDWRSPLGDLAWARPDPPR